MRWSGWPSRRSSTARRAGCATRRGVEALSPGYQASSPSAPTRLPRCALSDTIEEHLAAELQANHVTAEGLVVRVVAAKWAEYKAVSGPRKERHDGTDRAYPDGFPTARARCSPSSGSRGSTSPSSRCTCRSTARTARSRTPIAHALVPRLGRAGCAREPKGQHYRSSTTRSSTATSSTRRRAASSTRTSVAPPQAGDGAPSSTAAAEGRASTATSRCRMSKLRTWYEAMLNRARELGVVEQFTDIYEHVEHLTSVRDFPVFEGDFFPDHLRELLQPHSPALKPGKPGRDARARAGRRRAAAAAQARLVQPGDRGHEEAEQVVPQALPRREAQRAGRRRRRAGDRGGGAVGLAARRAVQLPRPPAVASHWQFDDLERAHYTTMMILATAPAADSRPPSAMADAVARPAIASSFRQDPIMS